MKSWKTTLGGLLSALGAVLISEENNTLHLIGKVCAIVGPALLGWAAKDSTVTGVGDDAKTIKEVEQETIAGTINPDLDI